MGDGEKWPDNNLVADFDVHMLAKVNSNNIFKELMVNCYYSYRYIFICYGFNFTRLDEEFWIDFLFKLFFFLGTYFGAMLSFQSGRPKTNYLLCTRESPVDYLHLPERKLKGTQYLLLATVLNYFFTTISIWSEKIDHHSKLQPAKDDDTSVTSIVTDPITTFRKIVPIRKIEVIQESLITNYIFFSLCLFALIMDVKCYFGINLFKYALGNSSEMCIYYIHHGQTQIIGMIFLLTQFIR